MTCTEFDLQLEAYLAGQLSSAEATAIEQHAAQCSRCERILDQRSALPVPVTPTPPAELRPQVLAAVASHRRRARVIRGALGVSAIAAVAVFALISQPATKSASDFPGAASVLVARERALPELAALDAAERELRDALRGSPDDSELRAALVRVGARRDAISRLIRNAAS